MFVFCLCYNNTGEHNQTIQSGNEKYHTIEYSQIHHRFGADFQYAYDIALVKIKPAANFSQYIQTIELPQLFEQVPAGTNCLVAGEKKDHLTKSYPAG